jgi:Arc/MetJ-type ribon-helix-helix transcriptional regulator
VKLSVSLPDEDVEFLDTYAAAAGFASRSAVLHRAVRLLRAAELGPAYEDAFGEWDQSGAAGEWEVTARDGLGSDAAR